MTTVSDGDLEALAERLIAEGEVRGEPAADPVNLPMIRHWVDAMGDTNPIYTDPVFAAAGVHGEIVAPPAMAQVWTMPGPRGGKTTRSTVDDLLAAVNAAGYTGVVATNCEQTYHRYARLGDLLTPATRLTSMIGPKLTALGQGYFVTWNVTWYDADGEPVTEMLFRVLKFRPRTRGESGNGAASREAAATAAREAASRPAAPGATAQAEGGGPAKGSAGPGSGGGRRPYPLKPAKNQDTEFFWEGVAAGELRIQRCGDCGALRHPPGPMCLACRSTATGYTVAAGTGEVYSYVVHHHPPVPGRETPFVVAVVALPEGVRVVGNVVDCAPEDVGIGLPVRVTFQAMDDELTLPMWTPLDEPAGGTR
ncbi:bifunctional MaoC family dehydratase N-terminal/OB-fold nucleic acid binding domain-containing protein [Bailinhaonella thermotolerans]|uniref:DNA-binding protein n=1 Tax=Bailinhaonella thermotolerans TaxID=1070861 RepID=A0A3A4AAL6_9ACTN|nr:bifunctional MaoC family dehydratase N-terminal/OB-fold nucleic acid binding domain-containing protein [Bailinhaonella thermotolerans]RJL25129.1 DNA-binding protein [Bailinhaonella thermotolerans]